MTNNYKFSILQREYGVTTTTHGDIDIILVTMRICVFKFLRTKVNMPFNVALIEL